MGAAGNSLKSNKTHFTELKEITMTSLMVSMTAFIAGIIANYINAVLMATVMVLIHIIGRKLPLKFFALVFITFWMSFEYLTISGKYPGHG